MDRRLISQLIVVVIAAILQSVSWLTLGGVRANLVLIVILAFAFLVKDWREYLLLAVSAGLMIHWIEGWDIVVGAFLLIALLAYLLRRFLPWQSLVSYLVFVVLATTGFYSLVDWHFIVNNPTIFFAEMAYNVSFGGLAYLIMAKFYD